MLSKNLFYGVLVGIILVILGVLVLFFVTEFFGPPAEEDISSFEDCIAAGGPVLESYPRQCRTLDGRVFSEFIGNELEKSDLIRIVSPRPNEIISSPLILEGEARGFWYFEADFPGRIETEDGDVVRSFVVQAKDEWMTENFVPFREEIEFVVPNATRGLIILDKSNPSGLPEHADRLVIPILFR